MKFIQFYQSPVSGPWNGYSVTPIPATGDRSVIILDGRERAASHISIAREECRKRGFIGFELASGATLARDVKTLRPFEAVTV